MNHQVNFENYYKFGCLLEIFAQCAGIPKFCEQPRFYFKVDSRVNVNLKIVVIHCTSRDVRRDWCADKWCALARKLISSGYYVIEIGENAVIDINERGYLNYCGQKSLSEYAKIIKDAELFVGIDSGFSHVANCFSKKAVLLVGRFRHFDRHMPYSGGYYRGENCIILRNDIDTAHIELQDVIAACEKMLVVNH